MESSEGRRLIGRLSAGAEIRESLTKVCRDHSINTGDLRAVGFLRGARLAVWDASTNEFVEDEEDTPPAQVLSLLGTISQVGNEGVSFHLQTLLLVPGDEEEPPTVRAGLLRSGEVEDLEFVIMTVDDFTLVRAPGGEGVSPWINIKRVGGPDEPIAPTERTEFLPGRLGSSSLDDPEPDYDLKPDDLLDHPRLGRCVVLQVPDEDRATVRLESGRTVELHLGMIRLKRKKTRDDGRQVFGVSMRRRP